MDYQKIVSIAAPTLTPLGPASILVTGLHAGLVASGMDINAAWIPAVASGIGMELSGFAASKMAVRAIKNGDWFSFIGAIVGMALYIYFAAQGMAKIQNSGVFQTFVYFSAAAYFIYGLCEYMENRDKKKVKAAEVTIEISDKELSQENKRRQSEIEFQRQQAEIENSRMEATARADAIRLDAQTRLENAQKNREKAAAKRVHSSSGIPLDANGRTYNFTPDKLKAVRDFLSANPDASESEVSAAVGLKRSATYLYMAEAVK